MTIIKLQGGLGNQLFQYAFGRLFSVLNNEEVKFYFISNKNDTSREYILNKFNTHTSFISEDVYEIVKIGIIVKILRKISGNYHIGYEENILKLKKKYIEGYFQSYKYLEPIKEILFREISLVEPIETKYSDIVEEIKNSDSVCVHVRRGDYISNPEFSICGIDYYLQAISIISEKIKNPSFYIFSDDIKWCKENLKLSYEISFIENNLPEESLIMGSLCRHSIIGNSSFGFWMAWLNKNQNKIVIAPKKWSNKHKKEYEDICPPDWVRI